MTVRIPVKGNDEFSGLASDVNKFVEMLQKIIQDLNLSQNALNEASESLEQSAQGSASAASEILANIESVRKQSKNQADSVINTSSVLDSSSETVDKLSELIESQAAGIAQSSAAIEEMLGNISTVTTSAGKMADSFAEKALHLLYGASRREGAKPFLQRQRLSDAENRYAGGDFRGRKNPACPRSGGRFRFGGAVS